MEASAGSGVGVAGGEGVCVRQVVVAGLMDDKGRQVLPESAGGPETGTQWAISVACVDVEPPAPGARVRLVGVLRGRALSVESWVHVPDPYPWASEHRSDDGVPGEDLDRIMEALPERWNVISLGASKTHAGMWIPVPPDAPAS